MLISAVQEFNRRQQAWYANRTGIVVDIENIGKNTELIATKEEFFLRKIQHGVWLKKECVTFPDGNFVNIYDLFWDPKQAKVIPEVHSSNKSYSLLTEVKKHDDVLAVINGGFFFLTDISRSTPVDLPYNLCIRNARLFGLPSWDQPIVYIKNGELHTYEPRAIGDIKIGKTDITWVGANSDFGMQEQADCVLYNSKCSDVVKVRDPKTNIQIGILDEDHITTPKKKSVVDIVINHNKKGELYVSEIVNGGGTHYFKGLFILQLKRKKHLVQKGDKVSPLTLDGLNLSDISSAITIGKRLEDPFFLDPVRSERRDARSLIAQDKQGRNHLIVVDGSKYVPGFHGASAKDIKKYYAKNTFRWVYFLDGGGSSRLIARKKDILHILANQFVFRKLSNGTMLWDWKKGRDVTSSIVLRST